MKYRRNDEEAKVPKISKALFIMKWSGVFTDFLHKMAGILMIPLYYFVREDSTPGRSLPALAPDSPHSDDYGSIEVEMIDFSSYAH